jgi:hypothetical protein
MFTSGPGPIVALAHDGRDLEFMTLRGPFGARHRSRNTRTRDATFRDTGPDRVPRAAPACYAARPELSHEVRAFVADTGA